MNDRILNLRTGDVIAQNAVTAANPFSRMRGLLGRRGLPDGEAVVLRPASSIHTMFMLFSIDVLFLDRNDTVIKYVRNLAPFRFSAARRAQTVIEMKGNFLTDFDLEVGDRLAIGQDPPATRV